MADSEFDELLNAILEDPEKVLNKADLDTDKIIALQKRLNPYGMKKTVQNKFAAISQTNLVESYVRRLTMTGMVGFLYQMLEEYEIDPKLRRWQTKKKRGGSEEPLANPMDILEPDNMIQRAETLLVLAKKVKESVDKVEPLRHKRLEKELLIDDTADPIDYRKQQEDARAAAEEENDNLQSVEAMKYLFIRNAYYTGQEADDKFDEVVKEAKKYPKIKTELQYDEVKRKRIPLQQLEVPEKVVKDLFKGFIDNWFEYNPNDHVKNAYDRDQIAESIKTKMENGSLKIYDEDDPDRLPIEVLAYERPKMDDSVFSIEEREAVRELTSSKSRHNMILSLIRDERLFKQASLIAGNPGKFMDVIAPLRPESDVRKTLEHIPPQDTFHRWDYYMEVNYEELRAVTECLYPEKPYLENAFIIYDTFEGDEKSAERWFGDFTTTMQDRLVMEPSLTQIGAWVLTAPFKENREKLEFLNRETEAIKRIFERREQDKKLGKDLMMKKGKKAKAKNIKEDGPDDPGLARYKANLADSIGKLGVKNVITEKERKYLEKAFGDEGIAKELEYIDVMEVRIDELEKELLEKGSLKRVDEIELKRLRKDREKALEMLKVPEDQIQVDVFNYNAKKGEFTKTKFYTDAEAPDYMSGEKEDKGKAKITEDTPLAPFAQKYLDDELGAEREREKNKIITAQAAMNEAEEKEKEDAEDEEFDD